MVIFHYFVCASLWSYQNKKENHPHARGIKIILLYIIFFSFSFLFFLFFDKWKRVFDEHENDIDMGENNRDRNIKFLLTFLFVISHFLVGGMTQRFQSKFIHVFLFFSFRRKLLRSQIKMCFTVSSSRERKIIIKSMINHILLLLLLLLQEKWILKEVNGYAINWFLSSSSIIVWALVEEKEVLNALFHVTSSFNELENYFLYFISQQTFRSSVPLITTKSIRLFHLIP